MKSITSAMNAVDHWFFGKGDSHTLAMVRILVGCLALVNLLFLFPTIPDFFLETGFVPLKSNLIYFGEMNRINLLSGAADPTLVYAFFGVGLLATIGVILGWYTRLNTIVFALFFISLHHRNGLILHGGDTILRQLAILLAVSPCGWAYSLDRKRAIAKGQADPAEIQVSLWPQKLIQIQVAVVYFTTVWHKWHGNYWREGSAVWYTMQLGEFKKFPVPGFMFSEWFVKLTSYGTLLVELALATLVFFKPFRKWVLILGILMHGFIEYSMNIPLFAFLMVSTYVSFYEGREVKDWVTGIRVGRKGTVQPVSET